jgi:hypothetical protein
MNRLFMKNLLFIGLFAWVSACSPAAGPNAGASTNTGRSTNASASAPPTGMADVAGDLLTKMRSEVSAEIHRRMETGSLVEKDLEDLSQRLVAVSNVVAAADLDRKLETGIAQLEKSQSEAVAVLKSPDSKALLQFDIQPMLLKMQWVKAQNQVLKQQLSELASTLQEVSAWTKIMSQVVPQDQVREKVKTRLDQLLTQWDQGATQSESRSPSEASPLGPLGEGRRPAKLPAPAPFAEAPEAGRGARVLERQGMAVETIAVEDKGTSKGLSRGALEVARRVRGGATEKEVMRYVHNSSEAFALSAGQIIYLRRQGVSSPMVVAMLTRDRELSEVVVDRSFSRAR